MDVTEGCCWFDATTIWCFVHRFECYYYNTPLSNHVIDITDILRNPSLIWLHACVPDFDLLAFHMWGAEFWYQNKFRFRWLVFIIRPFLVVVVSFEQVDRTKISFVSNMTSFDSMWLSHSLFSMTMPKKTHTQKKCLLARLRAQVSSSVCYCYWIWNMPSPSAWVCLS